MYEFTPSTTLLQPPPTLIPGELSTDIITLFPTSLPSHRYRLSPLGGLVPSSCSWFSSRKKRKDKMKNMTF
jgi:hypothetical protein